jgi:hypothetical protein
MKYLETIHERNSAKVTTLIVVILLLLLFVVGPPYMDPPIEYGVAVNFGTSDGGSGDIQPTEPIKSEPREVVEEPQIEETKVEETVAEPSKSETVAEKVLTADNAESIAMKKEKAKAEAKAKSEAERVQKEKAAAEAKKKQEEAAKKAKLDALIGGVSNSEGTTTGGEGNDNSPGDKGQLDGNPYAPYKGLPGSGSGGMGYGLNGRGKPDFKTFEGCENEYGLIVVDIVVNQNGNVIEATPGVKGSNNVTSCLKEVAKKIAFSYKWRADSNAPARQYGKVSINFTPTK